MRRAYGALLSVALATVTNGAAAADEKKACGDSYVAAQANRDEHRLVAAREQLRICARQECAPFMQGQIVKDCTSWLGQVEAAMPMIVFEAKDGAGNDLSAVRVKVDGAKLVDRLDGTAVAVDPGEHVFVFEGNGASVTKKIVVREKDKDRRVAVVLKSDDGSTSAPPSSTTTADPDDGASKGVPTAAYVAFAAGGVSLVVGAVFTVLAMQADSKCPNGICPKDVDPTANGDNVRTETLVAVIGYGGAVVGAGLGVVFLLTSSSGAAKRTPNTSGVQISPRIGAGWAGIEGRF